MLEYVTLGWNVAGIVALAVAVAAVAARSVALAGSGWTRWSRSARRVVVVRELSGAGEERQRRALPLIGYAFAAGGVPAGAVDVGAGGGVPAAALASTFVTSAAGVVTFTILSTRHHGPVAPDWPTGIALGIGGLAGARSGRRLPLRARGAWRRQPRPHPPGAGRAVGNDKPVRKPGPGMPRAGA
jgi:hypothetical protein